MWYLHDYTHTLSCPDGLISDAIPLFSHCVLVRRLIRLHVLFSLSWSGNLNVSVKCQYKPRVCCIKQMCRCLAHKSLQTEEKSSVCVCVCVCKGCSKAIAYSGNSGNMELFGLWTALLSCTCLPLKIPAGLLPVGSDISSKTKSI